MAGIEQSSVQRSGRNTALQPTESTSTLSSHDPRRPAGAGGQDYLQRQAELNPGAFLTLIGKVLPMQITGEGGGPVFVITGVDRDDDSSNSNETGFGSNDASETSIKD